MSEWKFRISSSSWKITHNCDWNTGPGVVIGSIATWVILVYINMNQLLYLSRSNQAKDLSQILTLLPIKKGAMAFTTTSSRRSKPLFQISSNFNITTWLTAILLTVTVAHVVISAPTLSTDVSSDRSGNTQDLIGQVFNGLELIIGLGNRLINSSILDIQDFQNVSSY